MDHATIDTLNRLTTEFYARCSESFSATRDAAWDGWHRALDDVAPVLEAPSAKMLDLGCGNLRFEHFLARNSSADLRIWAIDSCRELLPDRAKLEFQELDIVSRLLDQTGLTGAIEAPACDLVCAFGLFHHVPARELRMRLLDAMIDKTAPGGFVVISLWQLEKDARLLAKAKRATDCATRLHPELQLEAHDWLMGWQDRDDVFRYCHGFDDAEVDALVAHAGDRVRLVDRYAADGKSGDLNQYLVFRKDA